MKSYPKSVYVDLVTGRVDQATNFSEKPHQNTERYHLIGYHHTFSSINTTFVNRNMQIHIIGNGYDFHIDIPKNIRKMRRNIKTQQKMAALEREKANKPENILKEAQKAINIVGKPRYENYGLTKNEYIKSSYNDGSGFHAEPDEGYRGCGVYRIAIKNRKITATLYGGFHNSCPYGIDRNKWVEIVSKELEKYGTVVKADGSGTQFFLRNSEDAELIKTKEYDVPAPNGDGSHGFMHHNVQIK